jgi:hypothetical protein
MRLPLVYVLFALATAACGGGYGGGSGSSSSRDAITEAELAELTRLNVFEVVQRLRPLWLRTRGEDSLFSSNAVVVYLDGARIGGPDALRSIAAADVQEVDYLDSREATTRYGAGHASGAILVRTRRGG